MGIHERQRSRRGRAVIAGGAALVGASTLLPWTTTGLVADRSGVAAASSLISGSVVTRGTGGLAIGIGLLALPSLAAAVWAALSLLPARADDGRERLPVEALGLATTLTAVAVVIATAALGRWHVGPVIAIAGAAALVGSIAGPRVAARRERKR